MQGALRVPVRGFQMLEKRLINLGDDVHQIFSLDSGRSNERSKVEEIRPVYLDVVMYTIFYCLKKI